MRGRCILRCVDSIALLRTLIETVQAIGLCTPVILYNEHAVHIIKLVSRYNVTLFMARQRLKSLMLFYVIHLTSRVQLTLNIIVTVRHSFSPVLSAVQFVSFTVISNRMKDYFNTSSYYRVYAFLKGPFVNELKQKQNIIIFVKLVVLK